jgi:nucleoredoxin
LEAKLSASTSPPIGVVHAVGLPHNWRNITKTLKQSIQVLRLSLRPPIEMTHPSRNITVRCPGWRCPTPIELAKTHCLKNSVRCVLCFGRNNNTVSGSCELNLSLLSSPLFPPFFPPPPVCTEVQGIPTFVLIDENGNTITTDGRKAISSDPTGVDFPWKPPTLEEALGDEFIKNDGTVVTRASLAGKKLALYFSAHWCGPCRGFTPELVKMYNSMKASGRDDFEFIFCSSDRDENAFKEYHSEMPWLALPFANRKGKDALSARFKVQGIPTLVTIDENGFTIATDARGRAGGDPEGKEFPWAPKPVNDLSNGPGQINEIPSLCLMMEKCPASKQSEYEAMLLPLAESVFAAKATPDADPSMLFFTAKTDGGIGSQLRTMTNMGTCEADKPQLVLLDLGAGGKYYTFPSSDVTKESIANFVSVYQAGSLEAQQMSR